MKKKDKEAEDKENKEFREKIVDFLNTFSGKKEILETIEVGLSIEIVKLSWTEEDLSTERVMLYANVSRVDELDSEPIVFFDLNPPPPGFSDFVCDDIYITLSDAFLAYGKDLVRESFANAVKEMTGEYPRDYVRIDRQIYGKPLDNTFIKGNVRGGKDPLADTELLSQHYKEVLAIWIEAAEWYSLLMKSQHSDRKKYWKEDIKKLYPQLPDNLIVRLQPFHEYPDDVARICSEQGGINKPEDIALEHAAQICGASPYAYKLSTLQRKLSDQKRLSPFKN